MFQSLLFWISHFGLIIGLLPILIDLMFQSLLFWISHFGIHTDLPWRGSRKVSILVVLD